MVSSTQGNSASRYMQIAIAICLMGLQSMILNNRFSLSSSAGNLADYNLSLNGTDLNFDNDWKTAGAMLAASTYSFAASSFHYAYPTLASYLQKDKSSSVSEAISNYNYVEVPVTKFVNSSPLTVSPTHTTYLSSLLSSEGISNVFFFVSMIIQVSDVAASSCFNVDDLIKQYNMTGVSSSDAASNFFNIFNSDNSTAELIDSIFDQLQVANVTDLTSINLNSLNSTDAQATLLLSLSANCQIKKASMALTVVLWITYIITSGLLTSDVVTFYNQFEALKKSKKAEMSNSGDKTEKTTETPEATKTTETPDAKEITVNSDTEEKTEANETTKNSEPKDYGSVFLVFKDRWRLCKLVKDKDTNNFEY